MNLQTFQIELPPMLLQRVQVTAGEELRELITYLLERYAQEIERTRRDPAYAAYYQQRNAAEVAEEVVARVGNRHAQQFMHLDP